jgi:hypothetical protein
MQLNRAGRHILTIPFSNPCIIWTSKETARLLERRPQISSGWRQKWQPTTSIPDKNMIMTIEEMDMKIYAEARKYVYLPKVQRRRRKTNCPNWSSLGFWRCMNQWRKKRYKVMINEEARKKNEKWKIVELTRNCFCGFSWTVGLLI